MLHSTWRTSLSCSSMAKHREKNRFPFLDILGYLQNTQKSQIWKSETSPNQGTWLGIPWLGLVSLCQIWDFCGYSLNTLKYPILGICYFFLWVIVEGKSNIRVLLVRCVTPYKRERSEIGLNRIIYRGQILKRQCANCTFIAVFLLMITHGWQANYLMFLRGNLSFGTTKGIW